MFVQLTAKKLASRAVHKGGVLKGQMRPCCKQTCHTELLINSAGTTQQEAKAEYLSLSCGEYTLPYDMQVIWAH